MTSQSVTAVSDERLREFAFGPRHTAPLFAEMESMARELLRARRGAADVGETCKSCGGLGGHSVVGNKGDRYMSSCEACNGTGKQPRPAAEVEFKPTLSAEEHCKMFCAWKGGDPCRADDCPRRPAAHTAQLTEDEREALERGALCLEHFAEYILQDEDDSVVYRAHARELRRLASTAERE